MGVRIRSLKAIRMGMTGALVLLGGSLLWVLTDRLVEEVFDRFRPQFENQLSKSLGHRLAIGPYKGLRLWGLAIGATELEKGLEDDSTAKFSELTVKYAPIASLFNWRPVALITPKGTTIDLRANDQGSYWVAGPSNGPAPKLGLLIRIKEPAKIAVYPSSFQLTATSNTYLNLQENKVAGSIQLRMQDRGSVLLKGKGYWDHLEFQARAIVKKVRLEPLKSFFLRTSDVRARGQLDGDLQLSVKDGNLACMGGVTLSAINLNGGEFKKPLSSSEATIKCSNDQIISPLSQWKYGSWITSIEGNIPLVHKRKYNLDVNASIRLDNYSSSGLDIEAELPFSLRRQGFVADKIKADLNLSPFSLSSLTSLIGTPLSGTISGKGQITGPFSALNTNLSLGVVNPQIGALRFQEEWNGEFVGRPGGGGLLRMQSIVGSLSANLNSKWLLNNLTFKRLGGKIFLKRLDNLFNWQADNFRLDRVEVAIPPENRFKRIFGRLNGDGSFGTNPLNIQGQLNISHPRVMAFRLKEAKLSGKLIENTYALKALIFPPDKGEVSLKAKGRIGGELQLRAEALGISPRWISDTALELPTLTLKPSTSVGNAQDLKGLFVRTLGDSLDGRLNALAITQASALKEEKVEKTNTENKMLINPNELQGDIDAVVDIKGPELANLNLELELSGYLWHKDENYQDNFDRKPFVATIRGPLQGGLGKFSLINVPFSLLSLFVPVPNSLTGMFGLSGEYRRGRGIPDINSELVLVNARLANKAFVLDKGDLVLTDSILKMNIFLRSTSSVQPLRLTGSLPLDTSLPIELRIESHGDALYFLDGLTDNSITWKDGTADLRFLIRGTFKVPEANGFLVVRNAEFIVMDKVIKDLDAAIVFDFNRLELLKLKTKIGPKGNIKGFGSIALFQPEKEESQPLKIEMDNVPIKLPFADVEVASALKIRGSLLEPQLGGSLTIRDGSIFSPKQSETPNKLAIPTKTQNRKKRISFPEQKWNMKEPHILSFRDIDSTASKMLSSSIPKGFSNISFDRLRLRLGPNLQISTPPNAFTLQPLAIFDAGGLLTLNGSLDQTLNASGLVRLMKGRVNLFTTTFNLDRSKTNVAVFAPSMGLIPYVDITMTSRVPDNLSSIDNLSSSNDFADNGSGAFGIGGSRLVKVEVEASGPADRIGDNFELRSRPSMPRNQIIGLLGGNSVNSFLGGQTVGLANVIGRSFISPLLGNVSDSLSDRLQMSLYPTTFVSSPKGSKEDKGSDKESVASPQQAWVADIGIDLSKKFNFSLQATPNRSDIPPKGTLRYEVNSNLDALGSLDNEGNWQSQLQLMFKY